MENRKFIDNELYFKSQNNLTKIDQMTKMSENLKLIHKITTSNYTDFNSLINSYLKAGLEIFDMEIGIVSKISGEDYIVCDASSPGNAIKEGDVFPLKDTYCYDVFLSKKVVGIPEVGKDEKMKGHPVYQNMKLEAYISAPIYVRETFFGTLNFTSTLAREIGFSEYEEEFISMMANSIGSFLELKEKEEGLLKANQRFKKLIGFVAHDLRSPLGAIYSMVELFDSLDSDEERAEVLSLMKESTEKSLNIVHNILETIIVTSGRIKLEKSNVSLAKILDKVITEFTDKYSQKQLVLNIVKKDTCDLEADSERMYQVFYNLFSNVYKYALPGSEVKLSLTNSSNMTYNFELVNKIDRSKIKIREVGTLEDQSIGLGLELVEEFLNLHNSTLKIKQKGDKFISSFILPIT